MQNTKNLSGVRQFIRYVFVGGGATVVQWGLLVLLKEVFDMNANLANAIGFVGGLVFNYVISTLWVFDNSTAVVKNKAAEFMAFALIGVVGLGINQGLIWLFDKYFADRSLFGGLLPEDKYYLVGQVLATGLAFFWNFFARKYLLYNRTEEQK
ncbi:GtrA family protein [Ruminococcus sp.]|uniref:GtrA family protein n=1 Tax=Ruminococcus sp. TaxID=41978 RepID=UPI0025CBEEBD|nr:GtrA family protein [Ruminococcus sp.]MBQ8967097.1 GtrA family protein [Ruminococcus sp.]